jgi:ankyrin repeat protein
MGVKSAFLSPSETKRPRGSYTPDKNATMNGKLSALEQPWVKDRRIYEQKKQVQQHRARNKGFSPSSTSSYGSSSTTSRQSVPLTTPQSAQYNPFASKTPPTSSSRTPTRTKSTNPFHTPPTQESTSRARARLFEEGGGGGGSFTDGLESLNEFLDAPNGGVNNYQMPSNYSIAEESETTTLSEHAIEAARALKQSFYKRGKPRGAEDNSAVTNGTPGGVGTPRRTPPPTIPETREHNPEGFEQVYVEQPNASGNPARRKINRPSRTQPGPVNVDVMIGSSRFTADAKNLALHDMCDAAETTDDVAWRKAVFLLSVEPHMAKNIDPDSKMTALHVCSLGIQPPPTWMTRALLYTYPEQTQHVDAGGRLPLHLLAATSADLATMQLLVEEFPASVGQKDSRGFTPLQLMLKNDQIILTLEHLRILLGQTTKTTVDEEQQQQQQQKPYLSFRKGQHLEQTASDMEAMKRVRQEKKHEILFPEYPDDVRSCLKKITQWKHRQVAKGNVFHSSQVFALQENYINPASLPTPTGKLLPLHLLVRRKPNSPSSTIVSKPPGTAADLIRILVAAYPQALVTKDAHTRTPLMTAMLQTEYQPDQETIELLLGIGTPGFTVNLADSPAAIPADINFQLPLHLAADEMVANYDLISTIYEAHPQAVMAQDIHGRTPLHLALRNFRSVPVDEPTLALLFHDKVARLKDHNGRIPLDLVMSNPKFLKQSQSLIVQEFLDASIAKPNDWRESQDLLRKLRDLPSWLRCHACGAQHVQEALMNEVASPWITFWILLNGAIWVTLLVLLRLLLESVNDTLLNAVNVFASFALANQVLYWVVAMLAGEFYCLIASNPWRWIDVASGYLALATANVIAADAATLESLVVTLGNFVPANEDPLVSSLGSAATICIWISLVGYIVQWWCGMAIFFGSAVQLLHTVFWPLIVAPMGIVGMSQALYTIGDCGQDGMCTLSDAYTTVYWMVLGEPILSEESEKGLSNGMIALMVSFTLLWIWWIVSVIVMSVTEAHQLDRRQIALRWYWEPKVALTVLSGGRTGKKREKMISKPSCTQRYCIEMEQIWQILVSALQGEENHSKHDDTYWYSYFNRPSAIYLTRLLALIVLPLWFVSGVATLGLLWPPQLRRWLFSTSIINNRKEKQHALEEKLTASKVSRLKGDLLSFKSITTEQNQMTQNDLQEIKELLYLAMGKQ